MKMKFFGLVVVVLMLMIPLSISAQDEPVTLTMGSWRSDDVAQMQVILDAFHAAYPNITIEFDPTNPTEYNSTILAQLEGGTGPDLFYLRSFGNARNLYDLGYLEVIDDLPGLREDYSNASLSPWMTEEGVVYGVPFIATSHGAYYNMSLFAELGLSVPQTWEELLITAQAIKDAGYEPFANASGDSWTIAELVLMNLAPTFIGGLEGRLAYLSGERCFNDEHAVAAFQAVADLAPFLPEGQEALSYYDSQQLFLLGESAMWLGGSWDIPYFNSQVPEFEWSVFPVPPPEGMPGYVTFHLDAGMGLNAASEQKEAAKLFLEWMGTPEFATLMANELPGFFPMLQNAELTLADPVADEFLSWNQDHGVDIRWAWEKISDGQPDAYLLMQEGALGVIAGSKTPQQAADELQAGLEMWFEPAQSCGA